MQKRLAPAMIFMRIILMCFLIVSKLLKNPFLVMLKSLRKIKRHHKRISGIVLVSDCHRINLFKHKVGRLVLKAILAVITESKGIKGVFSKYFSNSLETVLYIFIFSLLSLVSLDKKRFGKLNYHSSFRNLHSPMYQGTSNPPGIFLRM